MKKLLRRQVIIRQRDFNKLLSRPLTLHLYDRANFDFLTRESIEHEYLVNTLKGNHAKASMFLPTDMPKVALAQLADYLYNSRYLNWLCDYNEDGHIIIRPNNKPEWDSLGWAVFERDINYE